MHIWVAECTEECGAKPWQSRVWGQERSQTQCSLEPGGTDIGEEATPTLVEKLEEEQRINKPPMQFPKRQSALPHISS